MEMLASATPGTSDGSDLVGGDPAIEAQKRTLVAPTPEIDARLLKLAERAGVHLDLEALRDARPNNVPLRSPQSTGPDDDGVGHWLMKGVQHAPPVSSSVDEGTFAAFFKTIDGGGSEAPSQLYKAFKEGKEPAVKMACALMNDLGQDLAEHYPGLRDAVIVPVMGHADTRAAPGGRTHALAEALGFGTVSTSILEHTPRAAVKEYTTAAARTEVLHNQYRANLRSLRPRSSDAGPINVVLVDDSAAYGCTCNEIARTIKEQAELDHLRVKLWVVALAQGVRGDGPHLQEDSTLNGHLSEQVHRQIEEAVDAGGTVQLPGTQAPWRAVTYVKFAADADNQVVAGAYAGSSTRQKYADQTFEKAVATRDGEHTRQLEKGTHHTWRMQRFFNKADAPSLCGAGLR